MAVTKAYLAQEVAEECGFPKGEAQEIVGKLLENVKATLVGREDVMISWMAAHWHSDPFTGPVDN